MSDLSDGCESDLVIPKTLRTKINICLVSNGEDNPGLETHAACQSLSCRLRSSAKTGALTELE